jgi:hypothetical protein
MPEIAEAQALVAALAEIDEVKAASHNEIGWRDFMSRAAMR